MVEGVRERERIYGVRVDNYFLVVNGTGGAVIDVTLMVA